MCKRKQMNLKWIYLSLAIVITLSFNTNAKSEDTLNAQFKYAKEAYQLGKKFYGDTNINTANLALILAQQHINKKEQEQATPLLLNTLDIYKSEYGNNAIELADIYILLGNSMANNQKK